MAKRLDKGRQVDPKLQAEAAALLLRKRKGMEKPQPKKARKRATSPETPTNNPTIHLPERADFDETQVRENGRPPGHTPTTNRRTPLQRRLDDVAVARMVVLGYTQQEIADRLKLSPGTVYDAIARMDDILKERALEDLQKQRMSQSLQLEGLLQECLEGIRESKKPQVSTTTEVNGTGLTQQEGADGKKTAAQLLANKQRVVKKVTNRTADVNYLFASTDVIKTQMKLLGTSAPQELRMVIEEREAGQRAVMEAVLAEVRDPDLLARIVSRVELADRQDSVAESNLSALSGDEDTDERE